MAEPKRLELYAQRGETSRFIDVAIDDGGQLIMTGQDIGKAPMDFWGDEDYEFWVAVAAAHKGRVRRALVRERGRFKPLPTAAGGDELLLALIEERYRGEPRAVDAFKELLAARGIAYTFDSWV